MTAVQTPTEIGTAVLQELERAWNAADGTAFGTVFTADADFVDIRGAHHTSAAAITQGHQAIFDSIYRGSTVRYRLDDARHLAPNCILAHGTGTLDAPAGPLQGVHDAVQTVVIVEDGDRWRIAAFHNTLVAG